MIIGSNNTKWIGTDGGGLAKLKDTTWTIYNTANSSLPDDRIWGMAIDKNENKWIGTVYSGVVKFNDTNWTVYNTFNSGLPDNQIALIAIEENGNKWFATFGGVAVFNEDGVQGVGWEESAGMSQGEAVQIYPNPFSEQAVVSVGSRWLLGRFSKEKAWQFALYDVLGQEVFFSELLTPNSELKRNGLLRGIYFYTIGAGSRPIANGKLVIQ